MNFEILLSCMYEKNYSIIDVSNINSNAIIVNQCNEKNDKTIVNFNKKVLWINSKERGLSKSRNMAIRNSTADVCLLADNDEVFNDDVEEKILNAYRELPEADIIVFRIENKSTKLKDKIYKLKRLEMLRVCSWQITFKRASIIGKNIMFDTKLGAGTGNGAGEENKFLFDCYDSGLNIYHYPANIARMRERKSTWFFGFDENFFYNHGMVTRYTLGVWLSILYAVYYLMFKYSLYRRDISMIMACKYLLKGIFENKLK